MVDEKDRMHVRWQIYEIHAPGLDFPRWVVASSVARALNIAVKETDVLSSGQPLMAWNATLGFIGCSEVMSRHTFLLLKEAREGMIWYDRDNGWERHPE